jgi:hypothetical protein
MSIRSRADAERSTFVVFLMILCAFVLTTGMAICAALI